jgi:hypothetical protein
VERGDVSWIGLPQDRNRWRAFVKSVLNLRVPYNLEKLSTGLTTGNLSNCARSNRVSYVGNIQSSHSERVNANTRFQSHVTIPFAIITKCIFYPRVLSKCH